MYQCSINNSDFAESVVEITYDDLENEEPSHQTELETSVLRNTLKASEKAQNNRQEHHENCKQDRRKDTLFNITR